tara:strand:- start:4935 stop:5801 length:867 start_codon:yes stop_codon:yes gene_type:complete
MVYLILSIFSSSLIFLLFKWFGEKGINSFQAIVVNYFVCVLCGFMLTDNISEGFAVFNDGVVLFFAIFLGTLFIFSFNIISLSSKYIGAGITATAGKISMVIPVILSFFLFDESLSILRIFGIGIALISIFLVSPTKVRSTINSWYILLPVGVFLTGGVLDSCVKVLQVSYLNGTEFSPFLTVLFSIALIIGISVLIFRKVNFKQDFEFNSLWAGLILGVPNYCSVYFLMKVLNVPNMEATLVFPINNMGIILVSCLSSLALFKEYFSSRQIFGLALSIVSIAIISFL